MAKYNDWKSDGFYDGVLDVGIARLVVMQTTGDEAWFGIDVGSIRVGGGTVANITDAKQSAIDTYIRLLNIWKDEAITKRAEL